MTSSTTTTQLSGSIFYSSFSQNYFYEIHLSQIISTTTSMPLVFQYVPFSIPPSTSPILSTSSRLHITPTSLDLCIPKQDTTSIPTIYSPEVSTCIPTSISSPPTPSTILPPLSMEIPNLETSHPEPLVTFHHGTISTTKAIEYFGKYAVVSLGKYF